MRHPYLGQIGFDHAALVVLDDVSDVVFAGRTCSAGSGKSESSASARDYVLGYNGPGAQCHRDMFFDS